MESLDRNNTGASVVKQTINRFGRRLFWPRPGWYRAFGILRGRGDCYNTAFDVWVDGYPRSANTFCAEAFQMANASVRIRKHKHLPPFIIQAVAAEKPGIFLLRRPADAVISWAIYWNSGVERCLDYYADFHQAMHPFIPRLFIATFEQVTNHFEWLIQKFNERYGTSYSSVSNEPSTVQDCFARIERSWAATHRRANERTVPRPSRERAQLRPALLHELQSQPRLMRKLDAANELYLEFRSGAKTYLEPSHCSTSQVPTVG